MYHIYTHRSSAAGLITCDKGPRLRARPEWVLRRPVLIEIYLSARPPKDRLFGEIDFELLLWWNPLNAKLKLSGKQKKGRGIRKKFSIRV